MSCPFGKSNNGQVTEDEEGDTGSGLSYGEYLQLDKLLSSQQCESDKHGKEIHDEHLFIIVHQVYELWFKQILHEIDSIRQLLSSVPFDESKQLIVNRRTSRVVAIMKICVEQIHILETMTALDFSDFRDYLAPASGFQSYQFRLLENKLGIKPDWRVSYAQKNYADVHQAGIHKVLTKSEQEESLLTLVEKWLERTPGLEESGFCFWKKFTRSVESLLRDIKRNAEEAETQKEREAFEKEYKDTQESYSTILDENIHNTKVARGERRLSHKAWQGALLISFYREQLRFSQPFQFLNLLMDLDSLLMKWRANHVQLVQRMLGNKPGTGGSSGYLYLRSTVSDRYKVFLDLFNLSSFLLPREYIPPLTIRMKSRLSISEGPIETVLSLEQLRVQHSN
ncbi:tryptophan 2,3-dioxygenase-like [Apostichopus japonicus]|uniref:tryptophan 2,3-dioxygenase-like n=1 Tax=Stichopus japonicus TaxID=307972 RepID=UPI003AB87A5B